ncbi:NAD(P)-dependent oxidoreductase [Sphingobacterium sp. SGG-5]|uniref:NAD-dependent epimerase/dehydratase family protein n=1 Tax=Sphingobacterium sp. SGG-5 TaxID=2710881 RepID=UPI0013EC5E27|nr:NAD(P)-dependent oxidoreductase [Sphingobacterium sp. SGG-5]NGM63432.1 NAD(P)-dependent oxidoreductase [Sphingobacterium sp. SGG-5]
MKILVVGTNSILSRAILRQHPSDEVDGLYHSIPSVWFVNQFSLSALEKLEDVYDVVYIVSAWISDDLSDSQKLFNVNIELVRRLCNQFSNAKIVYFSTVAVYDGLSDTTIDETTPVSPSSIYGISKLWAEKVVSEHKKFIIVRVSSMYGIGMKNETFLPRIIDDALSDKKIRLVGNGARKQNYICVNDIAVLAKKLALLDENKIQLAIAEENYSNAQVAEMIQKETGCEIIYEGVDSARSVEYKQDTFPYSEYNLTHLEQGIKELIAWKKRQF